MRADSEMAKNRETPRQDAIHALYRACSRLNRETEQKFRALRKQGIYERFVLLPASGGKLEETWTEYFTRGLFGMRKRIDI